MELSKSMRLMLLNLLAGRPAKDHCHGRSAHGGAENTIRALFSRGLITRGYKLTQAGRSMAERIREGTE